MNDGDGTHNVDSDWESRVLCSDESCIGTIGPDGCCRVCARPYEGVLPEARVPFQSKDAAAANRAHEEASNQSSATGGAETSIGDDALAPSPSDDDWERRILCADESCIGVIGPDGRCKECGKIFRRP